MITLRFVEGTGLAGKIIRWDTRCKFSHVEALADVQGDRYTLGAQLKGGVECRELNDPCYHDVVFAEMLAIPATPAQTATFWEFLFGQRGKPYDWRAIASFGLGERDWREDDSWFCSELQMRALEVAGVVRLPTDIPVWRITPRDVWVFANALKGNRG